mgnify:CR=1 FL=1
MTNEQTIDISGATAPEDLVFTPATFRDDVTVKLMDSMGDEQSIVRRARVSVKGSDSLENVPGTPLESKDIGLLKRLYEDEHGVPFEGVELEFYIEAPLFIIQQILKHRHSSINQSSGRYSELTGSFYLPHKDRKLVQVGKTMDYQFELGEEWQREALIKITKSENETWWHNYNAKLTMGIAKEVARQTAPHNAYASLYYKTNLRSLLNFMKLRDRREDDNKISLGKKERKELAKILVPGIQEDLIDTLGEEFADKVDLAQKDIENFLARNLNALLGGPLKKSHAQDEIELVSKEMEKVVRRDLPHVWDAFVEAGYYSV